MMRLSPVFESDRGRTSQPPHAHSGTATRKHRSELTLTVLSRAQIKLVRRNCRPVQPQHDARNVSCQSQLTLVSQVALSRRTWLELHVFVPVRPEVGAANPMCLDEIQQPCSILIQGRLDWMQIHLLPSEGCQ